MSVKVQVRLNFKIRVKVRVRFKVRLRYNLKVLFRVGDRTIKTIDKKIDTSEKKNIEAYFIFYYYCHII